MLHNLNTFKIVVTVIIVLTGQVMAQYDIPASVVGGGGGTASSTSYILSGTVGQPAVGGPVSSTSYNHEPGFWPAAQALAGGIGTGSVAFNGFDARLSIGDEYPIDPDNAKPSAYQISGNAITLEAWIAPTHLPGVEGEIVTIIERRNIYAPRVSYALRLIYAAEMDLALEFIIGDGDGSVSTLRKIWITTMIPGEWTHLAATYDSGVMRLFMDGVQIAAQTSSATIWAGDGGLHIGGLRGGWRFQGLIDEVRIWNVARTAADIQADMNTTLDGNEVGLASYWPLDEAATINSIYPVAEDKTANNNHLYMVAGAIALAVTPTDEVLIPPAVHSASANETPKLITHVNGYFEFSPKVAGWPVPTLAAVAPIPAGLGSAGGVVSGTVATGYEGPHNLTFEATNTEGTVQGTSNMWVDQFAPHFINHDNGNVTLSVFNNGVVGRDYQRWLGDGFIFGGYGSTLFQGNLVIAGAADRVSGGLSRYEFANRSNVVDATPDLPGFDQATVATFDDALAPTPLGVSVEQRAYSASTDPDRDYVILVYTINNNSGAAIDNLHIGLATDWDVGYDAFNNRGAYDATTGLSYVYEPDSPSNPNYYGVAALTGAVSGFEMSTSSLNTDAELYAAATNIGSNPPAPNDLSGLLATGPYSIPNGGNIKVAFAVVAGSDLTDLQANAARARQVFNPQVMVRTLPPTNITYASATLNGLVNPNGIQTAVSFEWGPTMAYGEISVAEQSPVAGTADVAVSVPITSLTAGATYHYRVVTTNAGGTSYGEDCTFTTTSEENITIDNQVVTGDGEVSFPNTSVVLDFSFSGTPGENIFEVVHFSNTSSVGVIPDTLAQFSTGYWEVNHTGPGIFTVSLIFDLGFSLDIGSVLEEFWLLRRGSGGGGDWTPLRQAAVLGANTITFTGIGGFSQFIITKSIDTKAPSITNLNAQQGGQWPLDVGGPILVTATVEDPGSGLQNVNLHYSRGGPSFIEITMSGYDTNWYGEIPSNDVTVSGVVYFVEAVDLADNIAYSDTNYAPVRFYEYTLNTDIPGSV
ncbi:MAG: hypothetical protein GH143_04695, partial [Calditrichaeota bacterium]|nr:hypothetical protein [Calditrichota bacterium]